MYCSKCGIEVNDGVNFCPACGAKILYPVVKGPEKLSVEGPEPQGVDTRGNTENITVEKSADNSVNTDVTNINENATVLDNTEPEKASDEPKVESVGGQNQPISSALSGGAVAYYGGGVPAEQVAVAEKKSNKNVIIAIICAVVAVGVLVVAITGIVRVVGMNNLKKELLRDWSRIESTSSSYYTLELDFSEDEIEYNFDSSFDFIDSTIDTYEYEVIAPDKIRVDYGLADEEIKVEFDEEKEVMIFTPALTSIDSSEYWYNYDY